MIGAEMDRGRRPPAAARREKAPHTSRYDHNGNFRPILCIIVFKLGLSMNIYVIRGVW